MAKREQRGHDASAIRELLNELAKLRELDRRRQVHAPGSAAYDAATLEVDLHGRRLMDRFRDFEQRRAGNDARPDIEGTRRVDAQHLLDRSGGSRLN